MRLAFLAQPSSTALRALNYSPAIERLRTRAGAKPLILRDLVSDIGSSYGSVFAAVDCRPSYGIELLSQRDMFRTETDGRVIRKDSLPHPHLHEIHRWQVLIAGTGTLGPTELYGRPVIADRRLAKKYLGPDGIALTFLEPGSDVNLYAYAFLCTKVGVAAVRSFSAGTKLLRPRLDMLASLPLPQAPPSVLRRVAALVRKCVEQRELYATRLNEARRVIEKLPELADAQLVSKADKARWVLWQGPLETMSAWNYAGAGPLLAHLKKRWKATLRDVLLADGVFKGGRMARVPCLPPHGADLLSQRDVFSIRPIPRRIQEPAGEDLAVSPDMLLLASRGQLTSGALFARVERAAHMPDGALITEDITRLVPRKGLSSPLFAFLSTSVGFSLLRTTAYGTSIPGMRMDLLEQLPVPEFTATQLASVGPLVDEATTARRLASASESEAIRIVEEEVLSAWLA